MYEILLFLYWFSAITEDGELKDVHEVKRTGSQPDSPLFDGSRPDPAEVSSS